MENQNMAANEDKSVESTEFDYNNHGWPRDFDIRIEVAEQREVLECL